MQRRTYIASLTVATAGSIAGCFGNGGDSGDGGGEDDDGNGEDGGDGENGGDGMDPTDTPVETDASEDGGAGTETGDQGTEPGDEETETDTETEGGTTLEERWRTEIDVQTGRYEADATADGVVVANGSGVLSLTAGGDRRWHWAEPTSFDDPGFDGVTVQGETVFAGTDQEGVIAALDADGGDVLWRRDRTSGSQQQGIGLTAVPVGDYLATKVLDPELSVLDPATGETVTAIDAVEPLNAVGYDGTLVVPTLDGTVALDPASGDEVWRAPDAKIGVAATRVGSVMIADTPGGGQVLGVDLDAREQAWTAELPDDAIPRIGDGHAVVQWRLSGESTATLRRIDPADGSTVWEGSFGPRRVPFTPVVSDGFVVVDGNEGYVAFDAENGDRLGSASTAESRVPAATADAGVFYACGAEVVAYSL